MGEISNASASLDHIHSWAKTHALDRTPPKRAGSTSSAAQTRPTPLAHTKSTEDAVPASTGHDGTSEKEVPSTNNVSDSTSTDPPPAAPPPPTERAGVEHSPVEGDEKPGWPARMRAGSRRFASHTKAALFHSWINILLVFVPIGIAMNWAPLSGTTKPTIVFAFNAIAIIPLAGLLSHATESVASRMGDTWASLLNVTFGNAVELIIFIIALAKNEIRIVQASILGSILANLLLILGMAFLLGGLRFREQLYNNTVTQMSACLLSLAVTSLLLPTAFHASFRDNDDADDKTTKISRGTSVVLLLVYVLYLLFQLKSHAYMYESTPQNIIDEESHPGVLADMLGSSSDDSDSSSSSDSDSSSDSQSTANRFKRAFRNRKNRNTSFTSDKTPSVPSVPESPALEKKSFLDDSTSAGNKPTSRNGQNDTAAVLSGDEADTEGGQRRSDMPVIRDFQDGRGESSKSPASRSPERKWKKKSKRKSRKQMRREMKQALAADTAPKPQAATEAKPRVDFSDNVQNIPIETSEKRPTVLKQFSVVAIPKVFTNTVFSTPPPQTTGSPQTRAARLARSESGLRRTTSLPDRMNRPQPAERSHAIVHPSTEPMQQSEGFPMNEAVSLTKDDEIEPADMSRTAAVMLLLVSTGLVAFCAELLVDAIPDMIRDTSVSQAFIGLIILPIVGNAAEHVTAVTVAAKNKMDLAIGVAVGSSIQIALFVTPFVVLLGWIMDKPMSLYFNLFETVSLFVTAFVVNFLVLDGRSNYLEGALLMAAYVIIAVAAFFYPNTAQQSQLGGGNGT